MPDLTQSLKIKKIIDGKEYVVHPETDINMVIGTNGTTLNDTINTINSSINTNTENISTIENTLAELENMISSGSDDSKEYTDNKIAELVSSAPETLDTLNEIASALNNDANFATTILNKIGEKANIDHEHPVVNETDNGLMSPSMAIKLDTAYDERSKVYYSTTRPEGLREVDLWLQPISEDNIVE